jgi:hypothetical protein
VELVLATRPRPRREEPWPLGSADLLVLEELEEIAGLRTRLQGQRTGVQVQALRLEDGALLFPGRQHTADLEGLQLTNVGLLPIGPHPAAAALAVNRG